MLDPQQKAARTDAALKKIIQAAPNKWGKYTAADLAAILLLLDWQLILDGHEPVSGEKWRRAVQGLPCAPDDHAYFADICDRAVGHFFSPEASESDGASGGQVGQAAKLVSRQFLTLPTRAAFHKAWLNSTPIISTPADPSLVIDLSFLAQHHANYKGNRKPGFFARLSQAVRRS